MAPGLESRHTSRYFFKRAGRKHTIAAVDQADRRLRHPQPLPGRGHRHHRPVQRLSPVPPGRWPRRPWPSPGTGCWPTPPSTPRSTTATAREDLGVRSTVIPLNRRRQGRRWPKTPYRRQMVRRFRKKPRGARHRRVYGQRWQAEICQAHYTSSASCCRARSGCYDSGGRVVRAGVVAPTTREEHYRRIRMSDNSHTSVPPRAGGQRPGRRRSRSGRICRNRPGRNSPDCWG